MKERVKQELAVPNVVHFYTWLLRSMPQPPASHVCAMWLPAHAGRTPAKSNLAAWNGLWLHKATSSH